MKNKILMLLMLSIGMQITASNKKVLQELVIKRAAFSKDLYKARQDISEFQADRQVKDLINKNGMFESSIDHDYAMKLMDTIDIQDEGLQLMDYAIELIKNIEPVIPRSKYTKPTADQIADQIKSLKPSLQQLRKNLSTAK